MIDFILNPVFFTFRELTPRGEMSWQPWQKDGAVGNLTGKMNSRHEMELLYDYTIEGQRQTETKVMKIEKGKLFKKRGVLNL